MEIEMALDKPEIVVCLTRREALTILTLTLDARLDRGDVRKSVRTAEERVARAFRRQIMGQEE